MRTLKRWGAVCAASAALVMALAACGAGTPPQDVSFDITIADRQVVGGTTTYTATEGDTVTLNLTSDEPGAFHLHGYDLEDEVGSDGRGSITFLADAQGRFQMEMHVGAGHLHEDEQHAACVEDSTGMALRLTATEGDAAGEYVATVQTDGFELGDDPDIHWHLTANGETVGMYFDPTAEFRLPEGDHELVATLSGADHCEFPVSDSAMLHAVDGSMESGHTDSGGDSHNHEDEHSHEDEEVTFSLGALEIRPR